MTQEASDRPVGQRKTGESGDWLEELRQSKTRAIARERAEDDRRATEEQMAEQRLRKEQSELLSLVSKVQVEPLLCDFASEVLDHPDLRSAALLRTAKTKAVSSSESTIAPAPWTGPVENQRLSSDFDNRGGRYLTGVEWKLDSASAHSASGRIYPLRICVTGSADAICVNGRPLAALSADGFKAMLIECFKTWEQRPVRRKRHHRHHRRWYTRLWKSVFPSTQPGAMLLMILMVLVALAIGIALVAGQALNGVSALAFPWR